MRSSPRALRAVTLDLTGTPGQVRVGCATCSEGTTVPLEVAGLHEAQDYLRRHPCLWSDGT